MIELEKYRLFITEEDDRAIDNILDFSKFRSINEFYLFLCDNWEDISKLDLPPIYQAILSFVFMVYDEREKAKELFSKYKSIEVMANYTRIFLAIQQENELVDEYYQKIQSKEMKSLIISEIEFMIWYAYSKCSQSSYKEVIQVLYSTEIIIDEFFKSENMLIPRIQLESLFNLQKSYYFYSLRKYNQGIITAEKGIQDLENNNINDSFLLGALYNNLGNCLLYSGSFNESQIEFDKALKIFESNNIERGILVAKANIAANLLKLGKFDDGLNDLLYIVVRMEQRKERRNTLMIYTEILNGLTLLGKYDEAIRYLEKALSLSDKYGLGGDFVYPYAVELYSIVGKYDLAEKYSAIFVEEYNISENSKNVYYAMWLVYRGILDFQKKNFYNAEKNLSEGIDLARHHANSPLVLHALLYLIELLLITFRTESDEESKREILKNLEVFCQESVILLKEYNSLYHLVNYQQLLAIVYIITSKLKLARDVLERTYEVCTKHNLENQLEIVEQNIKLVDSLVAEKSESQSDVQLRHLISELTITMQQYSSKGLLQTNISAPISSEPNLFHLMLILPSGLPCYNFSSSETEISNNNLLLAGMINAIQKFSKSLSLQKGDFRLLEHSDYTILLEQRDDFTVAVFTDKFSYSLKVNMLKFSDIAENILEKENVSDHGFSGRTMSKINELLDNEIIEIFGIQNILNITE